MAGIKISNSNAGVNPTSLQFPVNINGAFEDSVLYTNLAQSALSTIFPGITGGGKGLYLDSDAQNYALGDHNNIQNNTAIVIDDINSVIKLQGINIVTTGGVHTLTTKFLNLTVQGTPYVIQLLNP
jgi:hypothetical protein